jgi:hypothetical protein
MTQKIVKRKKLNIHETPTKLTPVEIDVKVKIEKD